MSKSAFESFLDQLTTDAKVNGKKGSLAGLAADLGKQVDGFLTSTNSFRADDRGRFAATESFVNAGAEGASAIGTEKILTLVREAGIPQSCQAEAAKQVAVIVARAAAGKSGWIGHSSVSQASNGIGLESLYVPELMNSFRSGLESFGIDTDKLTIDVKTAIVISMLKWHTTIVPRAFATRGAAGSEVVLVRETNEIYTLDDSNSDVTTTLVDLYSNPSLVNAQLKRIVPLLTNASGELVADGLIKLGRDANIVKLSINSSIPGYAKINRTDHIADGIKAEYVYVTMDDGTTAETFALPVPESRDRLTRTTNGDSVERALNTTFTVSLDKNAKTSAGVASVLLGSMAVDDAVSITVKLSATADLRAGIVSAMALATFAGGNMQGAAVTTAANNKAAAIAAEATSVATAWTVDARFSEENLRKSDIAVQTRRKQLTYPIPVGRVFVMDYAMGDSRSENSENAATLSNIIRIGLDKRLVDVIETSLDKVAAENAAWIAGGKKAAEQPGRFYALGGKVIPTSVSATLAFAGLTAIRDSDRSGDIIARTTTFLNGVIAKLHQDSKFTTQLVAGSKPTYRLITSPSLLANILGQPHIHNHLQSGESVSNADGVEYKLVLPGGAILEVITTTFDSMKTKMLLIPFIGADAQPELNFGINFDCGTFVSQFNYQNNGGANQRLFASARELPVVTNAIGAIIDVTGVAGVTYNV
jgi:hypothetical protein